MRRSTAALLSIAICSSLILSAFILPGVIQRHFIKQLKEKNAALWSYTDLLGEPKVTVFEQTTFTQLEESSLFEEVTVEDESKLTIWSKEGVPYYWVLVKSDLKGHKVYDVIIAKG